MRQSCPFASSERSGSVIIGRESHNLLQFVFVAVRVVLVEEVQFRKVPDLDVLSPDEARVSGHRLEVTGFLLVLLGASIGGGSVGLPDGLVEGHPDPEGARPLVELRDGPDVGDGPPPAPRLHLAPGPHRDPLYGGLAVFVVGWFRGCRRRRRRVKVVVVGVVSLDDVRSGRVHDVPVREGEVPQLKLALRLAPFPVFLRVLGQGEVLILLALFPLPVPEGSLAAVVLGIAHPVLLHQGGVLVLAAGATAEGIGVDAADLQAAVRELVSEEISQHVVVVGFVVGLDLHQNLPAAPELEGLEVGWRPRLLVDLVLDVQKPIGLVEADFDVLLDKIRVGQIDEEGCRTQTVTGISV